MAAFEGTESSESLLDYRPQPLKIHTQVGVSFWETLAKSKSTILGGSPFVAGTCA